MTAVDIIDLVLRLAGTAAAGWLAFESFQRRKIQLGDEPTLPRYFVRRGTYWFGLGSYCAVIALLFFALVTWWTPLKPLVELLFGGKAATAALVASVPGDLILPIILAAAFLLLVGWDTRFNPLLIVRDTVYDASANPRKVQKVYSVLRSTRLERIDDAQRKEITSRLLASSLDLGDFDKADSTVEYRWARNCVLFEKMQAYTNEPSFSRFFAEPSLKWGDICLSFNTASEKVDAWKRTPPHYTKTLDLLEELDTLNRLLCRLLACIVIFGSDSETSMWTTVTQLGGTPHQARLKHTWKYLMTYAGAIVVAVMFGRELSVLLYNQIFVPDEALRHFSRETFRWIIYAFAIFLLPIGLVFAARLSSYRVMPDSAERFYGFYVLMIVVGFLVSTAFTALVLGLDAAQDADFSLTASEAEFSFTASFVDSLRWGILPAMMCGFVAWHMDSIVSETEEKSVMVGKAVLRFVAWGIIGLVITLYATDDLRDVDAQLRFTVVLTNVVLLGALGAVTRFKTIQSYVPQADAAPQTASNAA
ncbi:MAG: hypothetical protein AAFN78_11055 [Pseudomonadota bacterium]